MTPGLDAKARCCFGTFLLARGVSSATYQLLPDQTQQKIDQFIPQALKGTELGNAINMGSSLALAGYVFAATAHHSNTYPAIGTLFLMEGLNRLAESPWVGKQVAKIDPWASATASPLLKAAKGAVALADIACGLSILGNNYEFGNPFAKDSTAEVAEKTIERMLGKETLRLDPLDTRPKFLSLVHESLAQVPSIYAPSLKELEAVYDTQFKVISSDAEFAEVIGKAANMNLQGIIWTLHGNEGGLEQPLGDAGLAALKKINKTTFFLLNSCYGGYGPISPAVEFAHHLQMPIYANAATASGGNIEFRQLNPVSVRVSDAYAPWQDTTCVAFPDVDGLKYECMDPTPPTWSEAARRTHLFLGKFLSTV